MAASAFAHLPDVDSREAVTAQTTNDAALWVARYRKLKGLPYIFDVRDAVKRSGGVWNERQLLRHRPFLIEPLRDQHKHKVWKKGRQVGVSELAISEELQFLDTHPNTKCVHTFPREKQLIDFVTTRVTEALNETPKMKSLVGYPNQIMTKRIGESILFFRSAWEANLGEGIDVDMVIFDEKDRMKEGIEVAFAESLKSSPHQLLREISTPTLPGRGVDASYQMSDQREWHVKCEKCGMWQSIVWPDNIMQCKDIAVGAQELEEGTYEYACKKDKCRGKLNRLEGRWIPLYPNRKLVRGYWMPQTIAPWIDATRLMQDKIKYKIKSLWQNYCLGETSIGDQILLTEADFTSHIAGHEMLSRRGKDWDKIAVGIDWGNLNWVVVYGLNSHNQRKYILALTAFEDSDNRELEAVRQIDNFIGPFEPDIIVPDAGYGKDRNAYLLRKHPGKVFACAYVSNEKGHGGFTPSWAEAANRVTIDRTASLRVWTREIRDGQVGLPVWSKIMALFTKHHLNLAPIYVEEEGEVYEVIDKTGSDHFAHAGNYANIGMEHLLAETSNFGFDFVGPT